MANQSQAVANKVPPSNVKQLIETLFGTTQQKFISGTIIALILILIKMKKATDQINVGPKKSGLDNDKQKGRGNVDSVFFQRILKLIKIVLPTWKTQATFDIVQLTIFLVIRTYLSIYIAGINGKIVKAIIEGKFSLFVKRILNLGVLAIPASFVNSYLDYLNRRLAIYFRRTLSNYFNSLYLKDMIYYQITNLDSRVANPEQRLTADLDKWASSLSLIYSNFSQPVLDIFLFSKKLAQTVGWRGPIIVVGWYLFSGITIRFISPSFGRLTAIEQRYQGEYRSCHTDVLKHSEEIAFYRGHNWEKKRVNASFDKLIKHSRNIMNKKLFMGTFDSLLVKYGAVLIGYAVVGLPVFGPGSAEYLRKAGNDSAVITRDYIRNFSLLINLAKAIGRLVISYKEVQQLAGYTTLISEMQDVLENLRDGQYQRELVEEGKNEFQGGKSEKQGYDKLSMISFKKDLIKENTEFIEFENMPIYTPNGDQLVDAMSFKIEPGMNVMILGPNGSGKSSLFRILGGLWPVVSGKVSRPHYDKLFYIPQRPYLPQGTLRDQIIYPHTQLQALRDKRTDQELKGLLDKVLLGNIVDREPNGFDSYQDWNDVLSGGEKQRIAMARLFYHRPMFAILDECTSAVSLDVEAILYNYCKELKISLFTVSHRQSLWKYHDHLLRFDGLGGWKFVEFDGKTI